MTEPVLAVLGQRVRSLRLQRAWTVRDVAERAGLSPRFLVQVESGVGNISVVRLAAVARALDTTAAALLAPAEETATPVIALLGLRGAGKTTVGKRLARRLDREFVELDQRIETAANLSLAEIFSLHGEDYYRKLEREALEHVLLERKAIVLATGGGIVTSPGTFKRLKQRTRTVWLRAQPEDHWQRVVEQGDRRPMTDHPQAMADLRALLAARELLYASADHVVDTSQLAIAAVVEAIAAVV